MTKWKKIRLDELFDIKSSKHIFHAIDIPQIYNKQVENTYPYVVRMTTNNGIKGYVNLPKKYLNESNTISLAEDTASFFYQKQPYFTGNKVKILEPCNFTLNKQIAEYLISTIKAGFQGFGWGSSYNIKNISAVKIQVPVTSSGQLDTDYMQKYVDRIEKKYVDRIEKYLAVLGYKSIDDCMLTEHDKQVLAKKVMWKKVKIGELFNISSSKGKINACDIQQSYNQQLKDTYPYVVRTSKNNGIKSYIKADNSLLNQGQTIDFGQDTAEMFYQEQPYFTGDKIKILKPLYQLNKRQFEFIITAMRKYFSTFSWGSSEFNVKVIRNAQIQLPYVSNHPDWQYMSDYITAIEKLKVIKLKQFLDKKLSLYQAFVN